MTSSHDHQIQSMLQKDPDSRPTAEEIQVIKLPQVYIVNMAAVWLLRQQLLERYEPAEEDTTAATHAKCVICILC